MTTATIENEKTVEDQIIAGGDEIEAQDTVSQADVKDMLGACRPEHLAAVLDGPKADADLRQQGLAVASLRRAVSRLQTDIQQRIQNAEFNGRELIRRRDIECEQLRSEYDSCLDKGDAVGADEKLKAIREARSNLVNVARNIEASNVEAGDLAERQEKLMLEALGLLKTTASLLKFSTALHGVAGQVLARSGEGIGRDLRKLDRVISDAQKDAEAILSEE